MKYRISMADENGNIDSDSPELTREEVIKAIPHWLELLEETDNNHLIIHEVES